MINAVLKGNLCTLSSSLIKLVEKRDNSPLTRSAGNTLIIKTTNIDFCVSLTTTMSRRSKTCVSAKWIVPELPAKTWGSQFSQVI